MFARTRKSWRANAPLTREELVEGLGLTGVQSAGTAFGNAFDEVLRMAYQHKWRIIAVLGVYGLTGGVNTTHEIHSKPFNRRDSSDFEKSTRIFGPYKYYLPASTDAVAIRSRWDHSIISYHVVHADADGNHQTEAIQYNWVTQYADPYMLTHISTGVHTAELFTQDNKQYNERALKRHKMLTPKQSKQDTIHDHVFVFADFFIRGKYYSYGGNEYATSVTTQLEVNLKRTIRNKVQERLLADVPGDAKAAPMILGGKHYIPKPVSVRSTLSTPDDKEFVAAIVRDTMAEFTERVFTAEDMKCSGGIARE